MAIDNMILVEFTEQELTKIANALNEVMQVLSGKVVNLFPRRENAVWEYSR